MKLQKQIGFEFEIGSPIGLRGVCKRIKNELGISGLKFAEDFEPLVQKMKLRKFYGDYLNNKPDLFDFLV